MLDFVMKESELRRRIADGEVGTLIREPKERKRKPRTIIILKKIWVTSWKSPRFEILVRAGEEFKVWGDYEDQDDIWVLSSSQSGDRIKIPGKHWKWKDE